MIKLSSIFSDRMMFQRETDENTVWGYGEGKVTVKLTAETQETVYEGSTDVNEDGYFEVKLPSEKAGGNYTLTITDNTGSVVIKDITYGDIFVCGGQSNMELPLNRTMERYADEVVSTNDKDIRLYKIQNLFSSFNMKKNPDNMIILEIDCLLDEINFTIDNGGIFDDAFEKLGKNIKNYIALLEEYSIPGRDLKNFLIEKKNI